MARVTITFEDAVGGAMDGSVSVNFRPEPTMPLTKGAVLTPAQEQAVYALSAVHARWETLTSDIETERIT